MSDTAAPNNAKVTKNLKTNLKVWTASPISCLNPNVEKKAAAARVAPPDVAINNALERLMGRRVSCEIRFIRSSVFTPSYSSLQIFNRPVAYMAAPVRLINYSTPPFRPQL
jgi:hypothetical protein